MPFTPLGQKKRVAGGLRNADPVPMENLFMSPKKTPKKNRKGPDVTLSRDTDFSAGTNVGASSELEPAILSGLVNEHLEIMKRKRTARMVTELLRKGGEVFTASVAPKDCDLKWLLVTKSSDVCKGDKLIFPSTSAYFDFHGIVKVPQLEANTLLYANPENPSVGSRGGYYSVLESSVTSGLDLTIEMALDRPDISSRYPGQAFGVEFARQPVLVLRSTIAVPARAVGANGTATATVANRTVGRGSFLSRE